MDPSFSYSFPALVGVQAGREYYVSMVPLRLLPRIFQFDEEELSPEARAQRVLNKSRVPELATYIVQNPDDYTFSAVTASIDGEVRFDALGTGSDGKRIGVLHVSMNARFIINDGQHRRAAIESALHQRPQLGDETIAVVFFLDVGLRRCQQMFADLNRHAIRPSKSLGVLYDHRDPRAELVRLVALSSPIFRDVVEMEKSTLSQGSAKLFTLSSIYSATKALLTGIEGLSTTEGADLAAQFWEEVAQQLPEWELVRARKMSAGEVRREFLHSHGIVLQSLGRAGNTLLRKRSKAWQVSLKKLRTLDWSRSNSKSWEGRAMIGGRVSKAGANVTLTTNLIKTTIGLPLTPEEQRVEDAYLEVN